MHLWVDGQCLQTASRLRGIGRYVIDLISALAANEHVRISVSLNAAFADEAIRARAQLLPLIGRENVHIWHGIADVGEALSGYSEQRIVSEIALAHHVACLAPDVALCASPFEGFADPAIPLHSLEAFGIPLAAICYDFIPLRFSERYLTFRTAREAYERRLDGLRKRALLLAISEFTASEAKEICPGVAVRSIFAGLAATFATGRQNDRLRRHNDPCRLLYVGALDWRKNAGLIAQAIAKLEPPLRTMVQLDVAGAYVAADAGALEATWKMAGLAPQKLRFLGSPSDSQLTELYLDADVLIQPSLMEGFGLTALEAMACGTAVFAARAGSLPEVVQNEEVLFDPRNAADLAGKITRFIKEPNWVEELRAVGRKAVKNFSWKNSASLALNVLEDLGSQAFERPSLASIRSTSAQLLSSRSGSRQISAESIAQIMALAESPIGETPRLLIDVTETIQSGLRTGIQRVVCKTVAALEATAEPIAPFYSDQSCHLMCAESFLNETEIGAVREGKTLNISRSDHLLLLDSSWHRHKEMGDLLRAARMVGAEITAVIYDLVPLRAPAFCVDGMPQVYKAWLGTVLKYADNLLCISRAVADDVADLLNEIDFARAIRIGYWPLGADFHSAGAPEAGVPHIGERPYFLAVGTLEPRKGHRTMLRAFEQLWHSGNDISLVFAGQRGWMMDDFVLQIEAHPEFDKRLYWIEQPTDAELSALYQSSEAVIAASFAEGFGLPLIEAARFRKPLFASDLPVFREVTSGSQSAHFFQPGVPESLASSIGAYLAGSVVPDGVVAPVVLQWDESAAELVRTLRSRDWYQVYEPAEFGTIASPEPFGGVEMPAIPLGTVGVADLAFVEGPVEAAYLSERYVVRVQNQSQYILAGHVEGGGGNIVSLQARAFDHDGREFQLRQRVQLVPLTVGPMRSVYLALEIERPRRLEPGAWLEVRLAQSSTGWFGQSIKIPL